MSTVSLANQIEQESVTSKGLDFFFGEDFTSPPDFNPFIIDEKFVTLFIPVFTKPKKKLKGWGLFKGLKIEEEEIEEAKKSLFPEREF
ncbi:MAG: hypothetical protein COZ37_07065 [bacterium (Candidatus Ratteibacteria) CG_4_10_14_3_um_filter_41_18]|uniref:Uncharacterized protein n=4 Tax=Candidatus Ratteibacteria TaxID=2979319 RepID=A0A2M7E9P3_9BACT|nr:MAG: hypothetical protein COS11_02050 [bacterium (Candidatus Ratteibacteria) CG01_land_8_20_14_3_00_40_19]PIW33675.1 MAG: hypothetical protein COW28_03305 [bacterium (Candidatus Ratteibacteria) CG15_BIG_FIL_POST_REV_8_21_14_020_41_12]PIX76594.1 MAG: hypothetical protein COZ37_07065 [bacterium (Candidatus Ratteibacteria) CG_4_10_14_3_um_filter_41_18]PJA62314.1 MAG: hypothetical protein CO162_01735 [bacterium (Candidatus Ratteibacteria) CG_4_9_14_3_um_filter_41_21]